MTHGQDCPRTHSVPFRLAAAAAAATAVLLLVQSSTVSRASAAQAQLSLVLPTTRPITRAAGALGCLSAAAGAHRHRLSMRGSRTAPNLRRRDPLSPRDRALRTRAEEEELRGGPVDTTLPDQVLQLAQELEPRLKGSAVYLVGMMGSGKTNVGRILHNSLKYTLFDTDELVETVTGLNITQLFQQEGEVFFRQMEEEVLQQLKPYTRIMVATGGGVVKSMKNWDAMRNGLVVWLDAPPSLLAKRLEGLESNKRPLLGLSEDDGADALEKKLDEIYAERRAMYQRADVKVSLEDGYEAGNISPVKVAFKVLKEIERIIDQKDKRDEEMKNYMINRENINKLTD